MKPRQKKEKTLKPKNPWPRCFTKMAGFLFLILITVTSTYGAKTMKSIYSLNRAVLPVLEPKIYSIKKVEMRGLMQIPVDNAVATNAMPDTNAVTLIEFGDTKVKYNTVAKDFKTSVGGGYCEFLPIFSEDTIGYSQTRGFNLLNIKTKKHQYYSIIGETSCRIEQVAVVDGEKRLFLFSIDFAGAEKPTQLLRLMDLSSSEGTVIQEKLIDGDYDWVYNDNTIILNHMRKDSSIAMNMNLEPCSHPIVDYIMKNKKDFKELVDIVFHPSLPFAIIPVECGSETRLVTWKNEDGKMHEFKIFNSLDTLQRGYKFSNDGKWVYFSEVLAGKQRSDYILMPVDPKLPHYLGKPIYLGEIPKYPDNEVAMTRNPEGLVVVGRTHYGGDFLLIKWDFTKALPLIENGK